MMGNTAFSRFLHSLPDETFFYIARNYLVTVTTPFHKPDIIRDLTRFFTAKSNVKRIIALLDPLDCRLCTFAYLFDTLLPDDLYRLTASSMEYYMFRQRLINLQERLILLPEHHTGSLHINPLLTDSLIKAEALSVEHLIPRERRSDGTAATAVSEAAVISINPLFQPFFITGMLSMFLQERMVLPADPHTPLTARDRNKIMEVFTGVQEEMQLRQLESTVDLVTAAFSTLGVLQTVQQKVYTLSNEVLGELSATPQLLEPNNLIALSLCRGAQLPCRATSFELLGRILALLQRTAGFLLSQDYLTHLIELTGRELQDHQLSVVPQLLLATLTAHRLLLHEQKKEASGYRLNPHCATALRKLFIAEVQPPQPTDAGKWLIIDTDYSVIPTAAPPIDQQLFLATFTEVDRLGITCHFQISKDSLFRAYEIGISVDAVIKFLKAHARDTIPQHLIASIRHWYAEFRRATIYCGVIIRLDAALCRVVDSIPQISDHIIEKITPEVLLMNPDTRQVWIEGLNGIGVSHIPSVTSPGFAEIESATLHGTIKRFRLLSAQEWRCITENWTVNPVQTARVAALADSASRQTDEFAEEIQRGLREQLAAMRLSESGFRNLAARIEKKLILSAEQLGEADINRTVWEAGGLDYQGKLNLCRIAIASGNELLEVHMKQSDGTDQISLIKPRLLDKNQANSTIQGLLLPTGESVSFLVRKIAVLRKLRESIYSPV